MNRRTAALYGKGVRLLVGDGDLFLDRCRGDGCRGADFLISRIVGLRGGVSGATYFGIFGW